MSKIRLISALACVVVCISLLGGCSSSASPTVMIVNGAEIPANEYVYYLKSIKTSWESSLSADIWASESGAAMVDFVKAQAADQAVTRQVVTEKCAELNLVLTKEEQDLLKENKKSNIANAGGTAAYEAALSAAGLTDRMFDEMSEFSLLFDKFYDYLYGENGTESMSREDFLETSKENYISAHHILFLTMDMQTQEPYSDERVAEQRAKAEEVLGMVRAGGDFKQLAEEYSEDTGIVSYPNGYTFQEGEMVTSFYEAALALPENEISDLVESEYGIHIIKRLPLDTVYLEDNLDQLQFSYYEVMFGEYIAGLVEAADVTYTEEYGGITMGNLDLYLK